MKASTSFLSKVIRSWEVELLLFFSLFAHVELRAQSTTSTVPSEIENLLSNVPQGASWQDLPMELRGAFESRANDLLKKDQASWGVLGLAEKEKALFEAPTKAMLENIDRILSVKFSTELPDGFNLARDVVHPELKRMLLRLYLSETSSRGYMLLNHPDFKGWDGLAVEGVDLVNHAAIGTLADYMRQIEARLQKIPDQELNAIERSLREKSYFTTRQYKHFSRPAVGRSGSFGLSSLYKLADDLRPFSNDGELLDAYNGSMFSEFREVNTGSLQSFLYDYGAEFDKAWLESQELPSALATNVLKLGNLYRTRVFSHPDRDKPCTFYSAEERAANWDSFTASMVANEDGRETMESYAANYMDLAKVRAQNMRRIALDLVDELFPPGSPHLSEEQRKKVAARIENEAKPAAIRETISTALDEATGAPNASEKFKAALARQTMVGGYSEGESLRPTDEAAILEMWNAVRAFIKREYSGYQVDIAALVGERPAILTNSEGCFAIGGKVSIGLRKAWAKASLYSTVMHEIKHAIDQNSHAAVEGAAWEGAATTIERQVWPLFIKEAMPGDKADQLVAQLITAVDNVRFTATTDATLKIFLRPSGENSPNTFDYAREIVSGYGYTDTQILDLRAKRANASIQYLQYDYGLVMYGDLLAYLQKGVGPTPRVDAYLLQACGMPSPKKNQASIDRLIARIKARK